MSELRNLLDALLAWYASPSGVIMGAAIFMAGSVYLIGKPAPVFVLVDWHMGEEGDRFFGVVAGKRRVERFIARGLVARGVEARIAGYVAEQLCIGSDERSSIDDLANGWGAKAQILPYRELLKRGRV